MDPSGKQPNHNRSAGEQDEIAGEAMTELETIPTVHILGGGPSGLSTAFNLTSPTQNPDWRERYNVVVHQLGWRLGGKGATGRDESMACRVEEHGIHMFGSMYSNALHLMNEALAELDDGRTMETEFPPSNFQLATDFYKGRWHGFESGLPHNDDVPWEVAGPVADLSGIVESLLTTVWNILTTQVLPVAGSTAPQESHRHTSVAHFFEHLTGHDSKDRIAEATSILRSLERGAVAATTEGVLDVLKTITSELERAMTDIEDAGDVLRWAFIQIDLLYTVFKGVIADGVWSNGIDCIDDYDYRTWLINHGASDLLMSSSLPQAPTNTCMQYPDGDTTDWPQMSASAFATFILRQMVAPGQAGYFFKIGTGDTVIEPIYQVLKDRGVQFEFFHKVTDLIPSADGTRVEQINFDVQATTVSGGPYDPLFVTPDGVNAWPNKPRFDQLNQGPELQETGVNLESWWADWQSTPLEVTLGPDDVVVVAMPPQAQRFSLASAIGQKEPWTEMISNVRTTASQMLQIWLSAPLEDLGWRKLEGTNRWLGPTYTNPISAFADFTETIQWENWPTESTPQGLIYFSGPLQDPIEIPPFTDHGFPEREVQRVEAMAAQYLRSIGGLLPYSSQQGMEPNSLNFAQLHCLDESALPTGVNRVAQQYTRANVDPNERYTVSAPATLQYRLKAWESGYDNVALSSDAIYTGFNIGSFEGAVMAGQLASLAVSGAPVIEDIYGYQFLHPDAVGPEQAILPAAESRLAA